MTAWIAPLALLVGALLVLWILLIGALWLNRPTRELAAPAAHLIPDLARLVRSLLGDPQTPRAVKVALVALLLWIVSPIDLIPEFIPVIGPLDDLVVTALVLRWAGRRLGREQLRHHWQGTPEGFALLERLLGG